ncbi:transmembrane protein 248-like [Apostichopus japonicus]|uniref:transmembrane protein 248-like n=1 Tax=Stichopus japonicus TaxID=307972 RepID=UPI003AB493F5
MKYGYVRMAMKPAENLKSFAYHRPPFIIFLVCILLFAVALISLGIYIQNHDVRNYEDKDWNDFFEDFSQQQFCIPLKDGIQRREAPLNALGSTTQESITDSFNLNSNVSFSVNLELHLADSSMLQQLVGLTSLSSTVPAIQIKLNKKYDEVDMTFHLTQPIELPSCEGKTCSPSKVAACVTLGVTQKALPPITHAVHPQVCNKSLLHSLSNPLTMLPKNQTDEDTYCTDGLKVNTEYLYDPKYTFYLSEEERSIINLHLMYTSYFLFIMLITCVFYALIKGPPLKSRVIHENGAHKKQLLPV